MRNSNIASKKLTAFKSTTLHCFTLLWPRRLVKLAVLMADARFQHVAEPGERISILPADCISIFACAIIIETKHVLLSIDTW